MFDTLPNVWRQPLASLSDACETQRLGAFLQAEEASGKRLYPSADQRLAALAMTPPDTVKVVILGQDPYHGPGQANGLAFSVNKGQAIPPSLRNIFKELHDDLGIAPPTHGDLSGWARQGVLLLNNALTVEEGQAGSHQKAGWEAITDAIIAIVAKNPRPCVFLVWGAHARNKIARTLYDGNPNHLVLFAPHPSPLSAHRGFLGCGHFKKTNLFLQRHGQSPIDWRLES
jgi:uracil-DNA glycosylase